MNEPSALPNLVIAGVGKAGTTSLFWYLSQHHEVCASKVKEVRYFLPLAEGRPLPPIESYERPFRHCGAQAFRLEASPQYFHAGRSVAIAMHDVLGRPKVIVMFRDPVARLRSTFRFMRSRMADLPEDMTLDDYVDRCLEVRERREPLTDANVRFWTIQGGCYVEHLDPWVDVFGDDLRIVFSEQLGAEPAVVVRDLFRWLGIDEEEASSIRYSVENRTIEYRSAWLQRLALRLNDERLLGGRRRLKGPLRRLYHAVNRRRDADPISTETRRRLEEVFGSPNAALAARLRALGYADLPAWLGGT